MTIITFKQLIDIATGTAEPGIVNFYALHCLLCSFAEQLKCIDEGIDCSCYGNFAELLKRHDGESSSCSSEADMKGPAVIVATNLKLAAAAEKLDLKDSFKNKRGKRMGKDKAKDIRGKTLPAQKEALQAILNSQTQSAGASDASFEDEDFKAVRTNASVSAATSRKDFSYDEIEFKISSTSNFEDELPRGKARKHPRIPQLRLAAGADEEPAADGQAENPPEGEPEPEAEAGEEGEAEAGETATEPAPEEAEGEGEAAAEPPIEAEEQAEEPAEPATEGEPAPEAEPEQEATAEPEAEPEAAAEPATEAEAEPAAAQDAPPDGEPQLAEEEAEAEEEDEEEAGSEEGTEVAEEEPAKVEAPPVVTPTEPAKTGISDQQMAVIRKTMLDVDKRLTDIENILNAPISEMQKGVAVMKGQLDLAMQQLQSVTAVTLGGKLNVKKMAKLQAIAKRLKNIQNENTYIQSMFQFESSEESVGEEEAVEAEGEEMGEELEEELFYEEEMQEHGYGEEIELEKSESESTKSVVSDEDEVKEVQKIEKRKVVYTKAMLSEQMIELRAEYCKLVNKINELAAAMLEQECMHTIGMIKELQEQVRDIKNTQNLFKKAFESIDTQIDKHQTQLEELSGIVAEHEREKVDRSDLEILLADKVDFKQLQRKASHDEVQELVCRLEKKICESFKALKYHEGEMHQLMNDLRDELGADAIKEVLEKFEAAIRREIQAVHDALNEYIRAQQEECIAAGARSKRIGDLACISCDSECTMRTTEKCPVPRPCNAHTTAGMGALVAFEVGSLRKDEVGYMAKDEFPHAPCAWLSRQKVPLKPCAPRHAGGPHTTHTAKDHVTKVLQKPSL